MKKKILNTPLMKVSGGLFGMILFPAAGFACACGCGIFEVGTSDMFPNGPGGMAFFNYDYQNQDHNWADNSRSASINNPDKNIRTSFFSTGLQYMFNKSWGIEGEIPAAYRSFSTLSNEGGGTVAHVKWFSLGDIRIKGIYTGFSSDYSTGIDFGLRLPTGSYSEENYYNDVDRDSEIGSGSTDILLGGYHEGHISLYHHIDWFAQAEADLPVLTQGDYRPGFELDAAAGVDYTGLSFGRVNVSPLAQVLLSERTKDYGADANSPNSGYTRILLSPGIEFHIHPIKLYADVEVPVFAHVNGDQLVAPLLFKIQATYMF